jgi:hypothetical protein
VNAVQAPKQAMQEPTRLESRGGLSGVNYFFALTTIISPGQRQLPLNS